MLCFNDISIIFLYYSLIMIVGTLLSTIIITSMNFLISLDSNIHVFSTCFYDSINYINKLLYLLFTCLNLIIDIWLIRIIYIIKLIYKELYNNKMKIQEFNKK